MALTGSPRGAALLNTNTEVVRHHEAGTGDYHSGTCTWITLTASIQDACLVSWICPRLVFAVRVEDLVAVGLRAVQAASTAAQDDNSRAEMKIQLPSLAFRATKMQWLNMPVPQRIIFPWNCKIIRDQGNTQRGTNSTTRIAQWVKVLYGL